MAVDARRDEGGVWPLQSRWSNGFSKLVVSGLEGMEGGPLQGSGVSLESPLPPHAQERGIGGGCLGLGHLSPAPFISFSFAEPLWVFEPRSPDRIGAELIWERGDFPALTGSRGTHAGRAGLGPAGAASASAVEVLFWGKNPESL